MKTNESFTDIVDNWGRLWTNVVIRVGLLVSGVLRDYKEVTSML